MGPQTTNQALLGHLAMHFNLTPHERRRGYRPEGTRRDLVILVSVNEWLRANPPRWLCNR